MTERGEERRDRNREQGYETGARIHKHFVSKILEFNTAFVLAAELCMGKEKQNGNNSTKASL